MFLPEKPSWEGRRVASLYERVAAHAIDVFIQAGVQFVVLLGLAWENLVEIFTVILNGESDLAGMLELMQQDGGVVLLSILVGWGIGGCYETVMTGRFGGTIGKLLVGIEVVDGRSGGRLGYGRSFGRWLGLGWMAPAGAVAPVAQFIPFFGYFIAWFDPQRRALHDRIAGAVVLGRS
jgi:uncharacterized RDD family membrane protein YckC